MTTVYTKPQCVQCEMTKRMLDKLEIKYETVDIEQDKGALEMLIEMGYRSAPVVITDDHSWAGFQPEKIAGLSAQAQE